MKFDSNDWRRVRDESLLGWMKGNKDAANFLVNVFLIGEVWDDLIDKDKPVTEEAVNQAFLVAIFDMQGNPFFAANHNFLRPIMLLGVNAWLDSVLYERDKSEKRVHQLTWSFVLRNWYMEVVVAAAFLVGGYPWMRQVSLDAREFFQAETLQEYLQEHAPLATGGEVVEEEYFDLSGDEDYHS